MNTKTKVFNEKVISEISLNRNIIYCKIVYFKFSSRYKTIFLIGDRHDITEILLKVALNTISLSPNWRKIRRQFLSV
jgi:hypothetical protein